MKRVRAKPAGKTNKKRASSKSRRRSVPLEKDLYAAVAQLLGGTRVFKKVPTSGLEFHDAIQSGFSVRALIFILKHTMNIPPAKFARVMGVSLRAAKQRSSSPTSRLNQKQSAQLWRFAKVLCRAKDLLGGQEQAEHWLCSPAMALDQRVPIDLLRTGAGSELVEDLLSRLAWCVST
jgi:putative toxin-antitoxin system antitoxin component (TIGR02293 family)